MNIDELGIDEVNTYHYSCALYIQRKLAPWLDESKNNRKRQTKDPTLETENKQKNKSTQSRNISDDHQSAPHEKPNQ